MRGCVHIAEELLLMYRQWREIELDGGASPHVPLELLHLDGAQPRHPTHRASHYLILATTRIIDPLHRQATVPKPLSGHHRSAVIPLGNEFEAPLQVP
jgi:hypothetical protein